VFVETAIDVSDIVVPICKNTFYSPKMQALKGFL
jgi:hypothetical protein